MKPFRQLPGTVWTTLAILLAIQNGVTAADKTTEKNDMNSSAQLTIEAVEDSSGKPIPCRMWLGVPGTDETFRPDGAYNYRGAWTSKGISTLGVPISSGDSITLRLIVSRGLEYIPMQFSLTLKANETTKIQVTLKRWTEMRKKGWWSGDLHVHRPVEQMSALLLAEDLNLAPILTVWNTKNLWADTGLPDEFLVNVDAEHAYHVLSLEDERGGGALLYFNSNSISFDMSKDSRWWPIMASRCEAGKEAGAWLEVEKPFWWEVPVWVALAEVDSIGLISNHFTADRTWADEVWGRHRDLDAYPEELGFAHSICDIYYHFLNLGFAIPPTAGAATGVLPNELGGNRTYVYLGEKFGYDSWWESLRAGRCFTTNGPTLLASVGGDLPGTKLEPSPKTPVTVEIESRRGIRAVEIVVDGRVTERIELDGQAQTLQKTFSVDTREAAWFAVRCFETETGNIRYAHTGPFYIKGRERAKTYKKDAAFFVQWLDEFIGQDWDDPKRELTDAQRRETLELFGRARAFYSNQ